MAAFPRYCAPQKVQTGSAAAGGHQGVATRKATGDPATHGGAGDKACQLSSPSGLRISSFFYLTCNYSQWLVVENFVMDRLPEAVARWGPEGRERLPRLSEEEITDATPCLRAAGEMLEADRISGSLFLARATERQSRRALSQQCRKVLRFPTICSLLRFRVLLPVGSLRRFAGTVYCGPQMAPG